MRHDLRGYDPIRGLKKVSGGRLKNMKFVDELMGYNVGQVLTDEMIRARVISGTIRTLVVSNRGKGFMSVEKADGMISVVVINPDDQVIQ